MNKAIFILLALASVQASATVVNNCNNRRTDSISATISGCTSPPCTLKKGSTVSVSLKFTPSSAIQNLIADVKAKVWGIPMSYPGVDGKSVCGKIFRASDNSPVSCPLRSGIEYIYKDSFPVSRTAPTGRATVRWALKSGYAVAKCVEVDVKTQ